VSLVCAVQRISRASRTVSGDCVGLGTVARHAPHQRAAALSRAAGCSPGERIGQRLLGGPEGDLDLGSHLRFAEPEYVVGVVVSRVRRNPGVLVAEGEGVLPSTEGVGLLAAGEEGAWPCRSRLDRSPRARTGTSPPRLPSARRGRGSFSCPPGQDLAISQVTYSNVTLTDTTNGITAPGAPTQPDACSPMFAGHVSQRPAPRRGTPRKGVPSSSAAQVSASICNPAA
jgi:hypothetical protein